MNRVINAAKAPARRALSAGNAGVGAWAFERGRAGLRGFAATGECCRIVAGKSGFSDANYFPCQGVICFCKWLINNGLTSGSFQGDVGEHEAATAARNRGANRACQAFGRWNTFAALFRLTVKSAGPRVWATAEA